ncbi:hypothetical protein SAMD00019534_107530 [Acytostelium subglobosum LB1]|uniref:hypothetical protein n=1 Tax=Acytostelium subglobosum LB1 TaxID=1410327 RepID=UPI000644F2A2|nr:hypothetical protein SAMD00019534_107530 [Acytostelium subglobosum LB1]GAM27577.1 hypothetical protein SAMD00019534_107530 [Acytostelium subglobosum LB1]|eukprot:XP_012749642.1 hypothetical protein SAMD00019534_107530 [Acytostelium subglobosum LB1]
MTTTRSRRNASGKSNVSKSLESLRRAKAGEEKRSDQLPDDDDDDNNSNVDQSAADDDQEEDNVSDIEQELERKRKERDFVVDDDGFGYGERSDEEDQVDDYSGEEAAETGRRRIKKKKTESKKKTTKTADGQAKSKPAATAASKKSASIPQSTRMDQFLNRSTAAPSTTQSSSSSVTTSSTSLSERLQKANLVKNTTTVDPLELYLDDLQSNPNAEMDIDTIEEKRHELELQKIKDEKRQQQELEEEQQQQQQLDQQSAAPINVKDELVADDQQQDSAMDFSFEDVDIPAPATTTTKPAAAPKLDARKVLTIPSKGSIQTLAKPVKLSLVSPKTTNDWWAETEDSVVDQQTLENLSVSDDSKDGLEFYYLTAEEDTNGGAYQGKIYLFGKVRQTLKGGETKFVSCCVIVESMERNVFLMPRDYMNDASGQQTTREPTEEAIREEIKSLMESNRIRGWKCKKVQRSFCFDYKEENKSQAIGKYNFWKVTYPSTYPALRNDISGRTFKAAYGITSTPIELMLLKRNIMGPSWLLLKGFKPSLDMNSKISWCRLEGRVQSYKMIEPMGVAPKAAKSTTTGSAPRTALPASPPVVVMAISTRIVKNGDHPEVIMVSAVVNEQVSIEGATPTVSQTRLKYVTAIRPLTGQIMPHEFAKSAEKRPNLTICKNERQLLTFIADTIISVDPDVLTGHNIIGFDLDVLIHRMKDNKVTNWSYLGRLKRSVFPKLSSNIGDNENAFQERKVTTGRLICDTYLLCQEFLNKEKSYKLVEICKSQLHMDKAEINILGIESYFVTDKKLNLLIELNENDCQVLFRLIFKLLFLPLTKQLTNLAGNLWNRSLAGNRAERIEYLLLHNFYIQKYILPDKIYKKDESFGRKKAAYAGGLVLPPKKAYYDRYVVLLDFNSLYPSIIQEHNVCFTTIERKQREDGNRTINGGWEEAQPPPATVQKGILPSVLQHLVSKRREVKRQLAYEKDDTLKQQLDIRQQAIKLVANSMYGCLGFSNSRFYALPLAELVTRTGRENLQRSSEVATKLNYDVIYGDTDSLMIYTGVGTYNEAEEIGREIKKKINDQYRGSVMEIELDGIFKRLLLTNKKRYAALIETKADGKLKSEIQNKGLDIVRRDWCDLTKDIGNHILKLIMSPDDSDSKNLQVLIKEYLEDIAQKLRDGAVPVEKFVITKTLSTAPEDYNDADSQPHVQVALAMKAQGHLVQAGDQVPYVITEGPNEWVKRAKSPKEVESPSSIDIEWYLSTQILHPTYRLTQLLGIEEVQLASYLGMSTTKYKSKANSTHDDAADSYNSEVFRAIDADKRFAECRKPRFECPQCNTKVEFSGVSVVEGEKPVRLQIIGLVCTNESCQQALPLPMLKNQLALITRHYVRQHQDWTLKCQECGKGTKNYRELSYRCVDCPGKMVQVSDSKKLLLQLDFMRRIFSARLIHERFGDTAKDSFDTKQLRAMKELESTIQSVLAMNKDYSHNLTSLLTPNQQDSDFLSMRPWLSKIQ